MAERKTAVGKKRAAADIKRQERRRAAIELRRAGLSLRAIAQRIQTEFGLPKYNHSAAAADIKAALDQLIESTNLSTEHYRALELERLDVASVAISGQVMKGDVNAIDRWTKIISLRAQMLGLNAPVDLKIQQGVDAELGRKMTALQQGLDPDVYTDVLMILASAE